jgi:hypothetical protein|tara:strand:+ start:3197 stop:3394 length:198 start_codon:yes stop_codon:yes gene_type:complete
MVKEHALLKIAEAFGGYNELIEIRKNKNHPQYKERIEEWLGEDYDPEYFDIDKVNKRIKNIRRLR